MELLAPAGGPEQLRQALHFGADAVYLAGPRWGMRAGAHNFSDDELARAVAAAHAAGAAVHLALNVVMTDEDIDLLPHYLRFIDETGVDAVIVSDLGALSLVREHAPHVAPHLSTQASCMSARTADEYARLGVRRVVLAREMTLNQIAGLRRRCTAELELEVFAHGSLCMAYSGRCLLSSELTDGTRPASRGACAQPCRWGWSLVEDRDPSRPIPVEQDAHGSYLLSSNDLCMIEHVGELAAAGVDALKLEGRAKGSYYVAAVTNAYRHVLDGADPAPWRAELDRVSHRPYSTGFFFGAPAQNPGRVDYARDRTMVAVVKACTPLGGPQDGYLVEVTCRNKAHEGDELCALSPASDVCALALRGLERWEPAEGRWVPSEELSRNGASYRLRAPFSLAPLDLLCR